MRSSKWSKVVSDSTAVHVVTTMSIVYSVAQNVVNNKETLTRPLRIRRLNGRHSCIVESLFVLRRLSDIGSAALLSMQQNTTSN